MAETKLVVRQCNNCGATTTGPEGYKGLVFCKQACQTEYIQEAQRKITDAETDAFLVAHPDYYDCPYNDTLIVNLLAAWKKDATAETLDCAYMHLLATGKILGKLTMAEVNRLDSPTYDKRLAIDPNMGGALGEIEARGNKKFEAAVSYSTGGFNWRTMERANLADRQRQADERAIANRKAPR